VQEDEHQEKLQSYYKIIEEDLEEITKEWSVDLLIPSNPVDISDIDSPKDTHKEQNTLGTNR
jgi:SET domain-containing protein